MGGGVGEHHCLGRQEEVWIPGLEKIGDKVCPEDRGEAIAGDDEHHAASEGEGCAIVR